MELLSSQLGGLGADAVLRASLTSVKARRRELEMAQAKEDDVQTRATLHSLAGSLSNIGAMHLARHCKELENQKMRVSSFPGVLDGLDRILSAYGAA